MASVIKAKTRKARGRWRAVATAAAIVGLQFVAVDTAVAKPLNIWYNHMGSMSALQQEGSAAGGELQNIRHMNGGDYGLYKADCWQIRP